MIASTIIIFASITRWQWVHNSASDRAAFLTTVKHSATVIIVNSVSIFLKNARANLDKRRF